MFVDPTGAAIGDTLIDEEGIAYAEFDLNRCIEPKQFHDVVGYYNRFDVFSLNVTRTRHEPVHWNTPAKQTQMQTQPATIDPANKEDAGAAQLAKAD
jgi:nitrilase